jgi:penicillin G amidase
MKTKKILTWLLVVILAVIAGGYLYARHLARKGLPDYEGKVILKGITGEVTVYRDEYAIPHIYADNETDLYRATGYVMAQDRLWQMDLIRRVTSGRLAEIFGEDLVDVDLLMRALRIPEKSRLILGRSDRGLLGMLEAYADGVNQFIASHRDRLPLEFSVLGYVPEEWKQEHCLNLIGYMAFDLTTPWKPEMIYYRVREKVGDRLADEIVPDFGAGTPPVYPGIAHNQPYGDLQEPILKAADILREYIPGIFSGSNNWAVSGRRSVTGKPILANDMHLDINAPGIWLQMHQVVKGKLNVTGVALPGQPGIICGHNDRIAWGMTNVEVDNTDFYLEKTNPKNPDEYMYNGAWRKMEVRKEKIAVKGGKVVERVLRFTHRGPVISGFKNIKDKVISMRWIGNEYSSELRTIYLLNRASTWNDFREAIKSFVAISQNIVYADVDGNIGLSCAAGVPMRKKGNGSTVVPGWTDEFEWTGIVPPDKLPFSYNPKEGFVSSANNMTAGPGYPHHISSWFDPAYRIRRIREMLGAKEKHSIDSFRTMHADQHSKLVDDMKDGIVAVLDAAKGLTPFEKRCVELFRKWDGVMGRDSAAAGLFEQWYAQMARNTLADQMGEDLFREFLTSNSLTVHAMSRLWTNRTAAWFDDVSTKDVKEGFAEIITKSFREAAAMMKDAMGNDPGAWRWGDIHKLVLMHPLGKVKVLDMVFGLNRGPFPVGGSSHTVCPYSYKRNAPFLSDNGASQRHIFSTADWDTSLSVIPTGNSGIPASPYYCDQSKLYTSNEYHHDYVSIGGVKKSAKFTMTISGR